MLDAKSHPDWIFLAGHDGDNDQDPDQIPVRIHSYHHVVDDDDRDDDVHVDDDVDDEDVDVDGDDDWEEPPRRFSIGTCNYREIGKSQTKCLLSPSVSGPVFTNTNL